MKIKVNMYRQTVWLKKIYYFSARTTAGKPKNNPQGTDIGLL